MNTIRFVFLLLAGACSFAFTADASEDYAKIFTPGNYYEVKRVGERYFILASSPFKDAAARRNMELMSKSLLFYFLKETDKKITGLDFKHFTNEAMWEEQGRLFVVCTVDQKNLSKRYEPSMGDESRGLKAEISKMEAIKEKTKEIHEQLKELYFVTGDIDNFDKQSDILMDMKFNEN